VCDLKTLFSILQASVTAQTNLYLLENLDLLSHRIPIPVSLERRQLYSVALDEMVVDHLRLCASDTVLPFSLLSFPVIEAVRCPFVSQVALETMIWKGPVFPFTIIRIVIPWLSTLEPFARLTLILCHPSASGISLQFGQTTKFYQAQIKPSLFVYPILPWRS
jgi:hypothetical protein